MTLDEFKEQRKAGLASLKQKIIDIFSKNDAVAIHQFGSFVKGTNDELSDLDIWITLKDEAVEKNISEREKIYSQFGDIVIIYEPPQNAPSGGMYSMVILETAFGFFHVDFYLVSQSKTIILPDAKIIFGDDSLPRGDWFEVQKNKNNPLLESHTSKIDFLICMTFIGAKYLIRRDQHFLDFLLLKYTEINTDYSPQLWILSSMEGFGELESVLRELTNVANKKQKSAISKVNQYLETVWESYLIEIYLRFLKERHKLDFWAMSDLDFDIVRNDPQKGWNLILKVVERVDDQKTLSDMAAGALEDLLVWHGELMIDKVEHEAKHNKKFKFALSCVWPNSIKKPVWERVLSLR